MSDSKRVRAGKKGKRKGSKNENTLAKLFKDWWGDGEWARTPQSGGWSTAKTREAFRTCGDLITTSEGFPFCVEAKNQENWTFDNLLSAPKSPIYAFLAQSEEQSPSDLIPLLVMTKNYHPQYVLTRNKTTIEMFQVLEIPSLLLRNYFLDGKDMVIIKLEDLFSIKPNLLLRYINDSSERAETDSSCLPDV